MPWQWYDFSGNSFGQNLEKRQLLNALATLIPRQCLKALVSMRLEAIMIKDYFPHRQCRVKAKEWTNLWYRLFLHKTKTANQGHAISLLIRREPWIMKMSGLTSSYLRGARDIFPKTHFHQVKLWIKGQLKCESNISIKVSHGSIPAEQCLLVSIYFLAM